VSLVEEVLKEEEPQYSQEEEPHSSQEEEPHSSQEEEPHSSQEEEEEEEEEDEGELALWCPDVQVVELQKERDKGLGFSILDYQVTAALILFHGSDGSAHNTRNDHFVSFIWLFSKEAY